MLNPDGAELEPRVNAPGIDINRDAKALQSPEGRLLLSLAEQINPQFGFNLHSQNRYYAVGKTDKSAVILF
ncbi:MAG: murein tripeptide amidase MpaA [Polaribacter sp.]